VIKTHPVLGARFWNGASCRATSTIVELHHERPDGRGYRGSRRRHPLIARVVPRGRFLRRDTTARAYEAPARATHCASLWKGAGTEFHADIVGALASALPG